jgi:hypothetical protein
LRSLEQVRLFKATDDRTQFGIEQAVPWPGPYRPPVLTVP